MLQIQTIFLLLKWTARPVSQMGRFSTVWCYKLLIQELSSGFRGTATLMDIGIQTTMEHTETLIKKNLFNSKSPALADPPSGWVQEQIC